MIERNTCFICKTCQGCYKHNICPTKKCTGNFDTDCQGKSRKAKVINGDNNVK